MIAKFGKKSKKLNNFVAARRLITRSPSVGSKLGKGFILVLAIELTGAGLAPALGFEFIGRDGVGRFENAGSNPKSLSCFYK